jgi:two-component system chemotaxis response regulator CheY
LTPTPVYQKIERSCLEIIVSNWLLYHFLHHETYPATRRASMKQPMKTLIVEDDFTSRLLMHEFLKSYGPCHIATNGGEAIEAVCIALDANEPYDLICLDVMMPGIDGHEALREIRNQEATRGIHFSEGAKVVMTTALDDVKNVFSAFYDLCDSYLTKPLRKEDLLNELRKLDLIS